MVHALDSALDDFKNDVNRVENLLNLTKIFRDFGGSSPPSLLLVEENPNEGAWTEALSLHAESKNRRTDLPIFAGSLLLYLVGRFEYCIKQIIEITAEDIASKTSKYSNLPLTIRKVIKQKTLEIAQSPKKYGHDDVSAEVLLENMIANIRNPSADFTIKSSVLSITDANMRSSVLNDALKNVGISEYWKEIGKQANVKLNLGKTSDQEAAADAQKNLNEIMEDRNQIAHPTTSTQFPDADKVLKRAEFLKLIASNTADLAKIYLSSYQEVSDVQSTGGSSK